jgi:hypothetical protein
LTLQAYGGATGIGYSSKIILNGGGTIGGNISFINDNTTSCTMTSSGVSCTGTLNVLGNAILNNATTCMSSLNVSGITTLNGNVGIKKHPHS